MKTVLIIEDDRVLRENTALFLEEEGFAVITAEDGLDGVQMVMKSLPDIILCDIAMPQMNGYEFYKVIQQINHLSHIPFVFLTAKVERDDIRFGMQLGVDDYITKPFDFNDLLKTINIRLAKYERLQKVNDEKFNALAESSLIGVFIFQKNKFVFYNEALAAIFGMNYAEFESFTFEELIDENQKEEVLKKIDKCISDLNSQIKIVFKGIHKEKNNLNVQLYASSIFYKGTSGVIGNMIEIDHDILDSDNSTTKFDNSDKLSKRELEILALICKGLSSHQIAEKLFISFRTVDTHRANILSKTACKNTPELIIYAHKRNLITIA